jgi:adenine-specific DNA-methyltransferase
VVAAVRARVLVLSYNDEAWVTLEELVELCGDARGGEVDVLAFDSKRYVGAQIGIHNPAGERVGRVGRLRNVEYLVVSGEAASLRDAA